MACSARCSTRRSTRHRGMKPVPAPPFCGWPWPLPAALATACGIALPPALLLPLAFGLLLAGAALLRRHLYRLPGAHKALVIRTCLALLLPLTMMVAGYLRYRHWQALPDPLPGLRGEEMHLEGVSDGRILTLSQPPGARVAVSPAGALPPGRVSLLGTLQEASGRRNPGGFDYRGYLRRRGVHGQVYVEEVLAVEARTGLRERLRRGVTRGLPPAGAALQEAMTLGVRDELGDLRELFAAAGLAHVLALSGLHVGLLMAAAGLLLAPLGLLRYPVLITLDLGFMLLVGATPSVVRAGVMVAVVLLALWLGAGRVEPWPALGLAGLLTLLARPAWLFDLSFQLSYGAVTGILLFALPFAGALRGDPPLPWWHPRLTIAGSLLTSAAAQALTLPLVAGAFGSIPLLSPVVNLLALPLASLLVPLGFAAGLLGLVALPLAGILNTLTAPLAGALLGVASLGAALPSLTWGEVEPVGFLYFSLALTALAFAVHRLLRPWQALLVVAAAGMLSGATPARHSANEIVALDVGQGDSIVLRLPGRLEVLVDGGGTPFSDYRMGAGVVVPALRALGVDELEVVVATHPDLDHIEGLVDVLREMPVQLLVIGVAEPRRPEFRELISVAEERGVPVRAVSRGEQIVLGPAVLEVLNPPPRPYGRSNDDSVAVAVYLEGVPRALLLGDVSHWAEQDLTPPQVDVLVVPHHGSAGSSSARLLAAAQPRDAIVSVGRNGYGHPSQQVLARLARLGARVHTTRDLGAVRLPLGPR